MPTPTPSPDLPPPTPSGTPSPTLPATPSPAPTGTGTAPPTATGTATLTATATGTPTPVGTASSTATTTPSGTPTGTATPVATGTPTGTPPPAGTPTVVAGQGPEPQPPFPPVPPHLRFAARFRIEAHTDRGASVHALRAPVQLELDFSDVDPRSYLTYPRLYWFDPAARRWTVVPGHPDLARKRLVVRLDHFSDFGFGGDLNTLPSRPPGLEGFSVDQCSGTAGLSLPLKVPPGINGLEPRLALVYDSGVADGVGAHLAVGGGTYPLPVDNSRTVYQASPVGYGWSLDVGAVMRGLDAFGDSTYTLRLNGRSLRLAYDGTYYRPNPDTYQRLRKYTGASNGDASTEYWISAR